MTTIEKTKTIPAALVANAQAVLANGSSSKAKRQEALAVLNRAGIAPAKAEAPTIETAKTHKEADKAFVKAVLGAAVSKEDAKKAAIGKAVKGIAVKTLEEERAEANALVEQADREARTAQFAAALDGSGPLIGPSEVVAPVEGLPVTADELAAALAIIARATKQQAEALRKAAAERKKVAPEGEKIKKAKPLTPAQIEKARKAEEASATYSVICMAAMSYVGKGIGESKKMQTALTVISLPALRWLAKRYDLKIPSDKKSALLIREFLRVELLTLKA
jgi:hypothetical protein